MPTKPIRFVRVATSGDCQVDSITDELALRFLQKQYGEETGLQFFVNLACGWAKCASVEGPYMIEYRGAHLV